MATQLIERLVETLDRHGIVYCHWKSNFHLKDALDQGGELDILVDRKDAQCFEGVLAGLGFKRVEEPLQVAAPSVVHFYSLDTSTNALLHLHVYYQVITGESLLKNYRLPLGQLLLQNPRIVDGIPLPQAPAELMIFVIRTMAKHTSLLEYLLLQRGGGTGYRTLKAELEALLVDGAAVGCAELLARWLPSVEGKLFFDCIVALRTETPYVRRLMLALRLRRQLKMYNRFSSAGATLLRAELFGKRTWRRVIGRGRSKQVASGGALIAFVGPEATGKSTLVNETASWLNKVFEVHTVHLGKPPSTWLTFVPNLALPILRKTAPQQRMSRIERPESGEGSGQSLLYAIRSLLLAWDRRALAVKVRRMASNGSLVLCDRYPSPTVGAMDSARLRVPSGAGSRSKVLSYLAKFEQHIYRQIPAPDVVIRLTVPVDVAIERNKERQKKGKESDAYLMHRHTTAMVPVFPTATTIELDSNQPRLQTITAARHIVWNAL